MTQKDYFDYDNLNNGTLLCSTGFGVDSLGRRHLSAVSWLCANLTAAGGVLPCLRGGDRDVAGLLAGYYEGWWDRC
ncbi:hypothetical protein LAD67_15200 [Escherichia coli]|nr:hypothetical protein [Escherichia coli]